MFRMRMDFLREKINSMIISDNPDREELLKLSQELDKLILQSMYENDYVKMVLGDSFMNEFDKILDKIQLFEKMYHSIRIVDPVGKKVLTVKGNDVCDTDINCYDLWKRQKLCDNCISMRAYNEDDSIFKLDHNGEKIFMLISIPVSIQGRRLVVELLKEVTNSMYVATGNHAEDMKMLTSIEHMNDMAVRDDLTGVNNRRYINERLPVDMLNSSLKNEPLSLIFADIDYFKSINDLYGHSAGDVVLREFAAEIRKYIRNGIDWVARYGGDEFLICLPGTDADGARMVAERFRLNVAQRYFYITKKNGNGPEGDQMKNIIKISLSCSFGIHTVDSWSKNMTVEELIVAADKKLYEAKKSGRNKVV